MNMKELQDLITEANHLKEQIEKNHCELQFKQLTIKGMEDFTEYLLNQKERLEDEKKITETQNEEFSVQLKVKEETA